MKAIKIGCLNWFELAGVSWGWILAGTLRAQTLRRYQDRGLGQCFASAILGPLVIHNVRDE